MNNSQLIGVGAIFAGSVLGGFVLGILVAGRTGNPFWTLVGLCAGLIAGGFGVARLLARVLRS